MCIHSSLSQQFTRNPPPPCSSHRPGSGSGGKRAETRCRRVWRSGTYHGTHVADIRQLYPSKHGNTKQQASAHPTTQEHSHTYTHTFTPTWTLPAARTTLQTTFSVGPFPCIGTAKTMVPKSAETRGCRVWTSPCWAPGGGGGEGGEFCLRGGGGGGGSGTQKPKNLGTKNSANQYFLL